jgi:hypothetical protein
MPQTVEVPDYVTEAAKRGLAWHAEGKSGDGVTDQTLREARDMVEGKISEDKVRRMGPWFQRHRGDMDAPKNKPDNEDFPGAGAVAWALWGGPTSGDIMRTAKWAEAKAEQLDSEEEAKVAIPGILKMTIEEQLVAAASNLAGITAERDDLRATVEKLTVGAAAELESLKVEAAAKDAKLVELTTALEAAAKEGAELQAKVAELEAGKVSASKEAAKIAASVGVAPVAMSPADSAPAAEAVDHLAAFLALPVGSKERNEYFAAHKAAIVRAAF